MWNGLQMNGRLKKEIDQVVVLVDRLRQLNEQIDI